MTTREQINPVGYNSGAYNAKDAQGYERGSMGAGKPMVSRIYSVWKIENGIAYCRSTNGWGRILEETFPVDTLTSYTPVKTIGQP
jgi:hypothetical protein